MAYFDLLNPWCETGDKTAPLVGKVSLGWIPGEQPPAQWLNWMTNRVDVSHNLVLDFLNNLNDDVVTSPSYRGTQLIVQPPITSTKLSGCGWWNTKHSAHDQAKVTENYLDLALDRSGGSWPLGTPASPSRVDSLFKELLDVTRPFEARPWSDLTNNSTGAMQPNSRSPIRMRVGSYMGKRCHLFGYAQPVGGPISQPLLYVIDYSYSIVKRIDWDGLLAIAGSVLPGGTLIENIQLEDFCCDAYNLFLHLRVESATTPGQYTLWIVALVYNDGGLLDPWTLLWDVPVQGAGGTFTRQPLGANPKITRCSLEFVAREKICSVASYVRGQDASAGVFKVIAANNTHYTYFTTAGGVTGVRYTYAGLCSDGQYTYYPTNSASAADVQISSFHVDTAALNPNYPVSPTSDNVPTCCIKCDGNFILFCQLRNAEDDILVMKQSGIYARVGAQDYISAGGGQSTPFVAMAVDGCAVWILIHTIGGAPNGLLVQLVRLDLGSIPPGQTYLKDLPTRRFYVANEVDNDWEYSGEILFDGRNIFINSTQIQGLGESGRIRRFQNAINR